MKNKQLALISAFVALVFSGSFATINSAHAQNAEKQNAIIELVKMTGAMSLTQQVIKQHLSLLLDLLESKNTDLTQAHKDIITEELIAGYNESQPGTIARISALYEKAFTTQEIQDLVAFYKIPLGQKVIRISPKPSKDSMQLGKELGESLGRPLFERIWKRLKKEGVELRL